MMLLIVVYSCFKPNLSIYNYDFPHPIWTLVMDNLLLDNKLLSCLKRPSNLYDFKKKVLSAMKLRCCKVTGSGTHSGDAVSGDKDVSAVGSLAVKLSMEMQSALDKQEAAC